MGTAGAVLAGRRGQAAGQELLRRDAPPARPGREPDRPAAGAVPGRAHHRARPAHPRRGVGGRSAAGREGATVLLTTQYLEEADQLAPHRRDRPRQGHRRRHRGRAEGQVGGQVLRGAPRATGTTLAAVAALLAAGPARVPDGQRRVGPGAGRGRRRGRCCRRSSASSTTAGIELAEFALRKASLDEVFLALTGHPAERPRGRSAKTGTNGRAPDDDCDQRHPPPACRPGHAPFAAPGAGSARWPALRELVHADLAQRVLKISTNMEDLFGLSAARRSCSCCCSPTCSAARSPASTHSLPADRAARHPGR